jgi:hypothetical protein
MSTSYVSVITSFQYPFSMVVEDTFLDKDLIQNKQKFSTSDELKISSRKYAPKRTLPGG